MLRLKYLLFVILFMMAYVANAQTIQIYKDGAVVKEYSSAEVDSVVYKPAAAQPRYYYYAGWDCPKTVEELEELAKAPNGGTLTSLIGLDVNKDYYPADITGPYDNWFIVIPSILNAYDAASGALMTNGIGFIKEANQPIANHTIWKSSDRNKTDEFAGIKIY